jgi:hypothetical protein
MMHQNNVQMPYIFLAMFTWWPYYIGVRHQMKKRNLVHFSPLKPIPPALTSERGSLVSGLTCMVPILAVVLAMPLLVNVAWLSAAMLAWRVVARRSESATDSRPMASSKIQPVIPFSPLTPVATVLTSVRGDLASVPACAVPLFVVIIRLPALVLLAWVAASITAWLIIRSQRSAALRARDQSNSGSPSGPAQGAEIGAEKAA